MQRKRKVLAVALALALSPAAWAGVSGQAAEDNRAQDNQSQDKQSQQAAEPGRQAAEQAAATEQPARDDAKESLGWTYLNGQSTGAQEQASQAKEDDDGRTAAATQEPQQGDPAASEDSSTGEQSASTEESSDADAQAATEDPGKDSEQAAMPKEEEDAQAGGQDEQQSAQSEDEGNGRSADSNVPAGLEGKVIVIVPRDWQGSLKDLVAALQTTPDAKDIVIVQQGEPQAGNEDDSDEYFAERPASNEQPDEQKPAAQ